MGAAQEVKIYENQFFDQTKENEWD